MTHLLVHAMILTIFWMLFWAAMMRGLPLVTAVILALLTPQAMQFSLTIRQAHNSLALITAVFAIHGAVTMWLASRRYADKARAILYP